MGEKNLISILWKIVKNLDTFKKNYNISHFIDDLATIKVVMKLKMFFSLFLGLTSVWANPFMDVLEERLTSVGRYFEQKPGFKYPFERDTTLNNLEVNIDKFALFLGNVDRLSSLKKIYSDFAYNQKLNLYNYDFAIGTEWEILPYPMIRDLGNFELVSWNSHFAKKLDLDSGVQSLDFFKKMDALTDTKAYAGNSLELFKTPNSLKEIKRRLALARNHVFMSSFLFQCDAGSEELIDLMIKKADEGVRIYLIIDKLFTIVDRKCVKRLRGTKVEIALKGGMLKIFHEKMFVFDGEYAIIDGQNMVAAQTLSDGYNNLINDTGVGIRGPLVQEIARHFIGYWKELKREIPKSIEDFYLKLNEDAISAQTNEELSLGLARRSGVCRFVTEKPGKQDRHIMPLYRAYARAAQNYIFFNMIDLRFERIGNKLGTNFLDEMTLLANNNPDLRVDMLTNQWKLPTDIYMPDGLAVDRNWFSFLITKPGTLLYSYPHKQIGKGLRRLSPNIENNNFHWWASAIYNHSKTMMIDNIATFIGSFNINSASNSASYEQVLVCHDEKLAREMQKSIVLDLVNSIPIPFSGVSNN